MQEQEQSFGARRADALKLVAETFLACRSEEIENVASGDRYQVVVHVDQAVLTRSATADETEPHLTELEDGAALSIETARRLACDGSLIGMVDGEDGEPLSVGRKTRAIPAAIQRALKARDGGCRFPGCDRTRFMHGHHVVHWANGGATSLSNLVSLCSFHHRLVHEGGFGVTRTDDGLFVFTRPDGQRISECAAQPLPEARSRGNASAEPVLMGDAALEDFQRMIDDYVEKVYPGNKITPRTAACKWTGERMDYSFAIESMQWHDGRAGSRAAADSS